MKEPTHTDDEEPIESLNLAIIWHRIQTWLREELYPPTQVAGVTQRKTRNEPTKGS
ncbi:hypothetical protein [Pseudomonas sp. NPDC088444]|uniref:hypothetical protein n=1 Tax=Pseudomonas sp. NPDC088444 TaxID=3364456 RepID=UPI00384AB5BE